MTFFSTADYRELVWIHPRLFVEDVSVVVVEVMNVLTLVVHCLMLLVYLLKIICPIGNRVEGGVVGEGEIMVCFQIH
jgi:hypothetical protein